jgi:hypothetical protein
MIAALYPAVLLLLQALVAAALGVGWLVRMWLGGGLPRAGWRWRRWPGWSGGVPPLDRRLLSIT